MVTVQIGDELAAILNQEQADAPIERVALEMIVLELYRRHTISSGRAAELLGVPLYDFIKRASSLGIPYIDMTEEEWESEMRFINSL
ncbi:MAG TPA: UPF0175 family protein [Thermomicrobiales bacterium]|jgi:predicted HTH domain antitoxin